MGEKKGVKPCGLQELHGDSPVKSFEASELERKTRGYKFGEKRRRKKKNKREGEFFSSKVSKLS